ncbi:hypothetical protein [Argonema galeatum]|uniref:hypothetical protein n=1 Tax=Argonema galeatum TaxID=2942762 RepID=UPI002013B3AE|nr:hypothetical protein [Argonema galeatum]MCL1464729.1 hypothetical protein [Argonema galeatum A003/A1]
MNKFEVSVEILKVALINFNLNKEDLESKTKEILNCFEMIYTRILELEAREVSTISSTSGLQAFNTSMFSNLETKRFAPTPESLSRIQGLSELEAGRSENTSSEIDKIIETEIERTLNDDEFVVMPFSKKAEVLREMTFALSARRCSYSQCPNRER